MLDSAPGTEEF